MTQKVWEKVLMHFGGEGPTNLEPHSMTAACYLLPPSTSLTKNRVLAVCPGVVLSPVLSSAHHHCSLPLCGSSRMMNFCGLPGSGFATKQWSHVLALTCLCSAIQLVIWERRLVSSTGNLGRRMSMCFPSFGGRG